jgi:hypothetical protein
MKTIVIAKEAWLYSQLSIAKYSGGIDISDEENGTRHFLLVDGKGQPYQGILSPREPADLVDKEFLPFYRKLGRDKFISIISREPLASRKGLKQILSAAVQEKKAEKTAKEEEMKVCQHSLFD